MASRFLRNNRTMLQQKGKGWLIVCIDDGRISSLDEAGRFIWDSLEKPLTLSQLADRVANRHGKSASSVLPDVEAFVASLCELKLARPIKGR